MGNHSWFSPSAAKANLACPARAKLNRGPRRSSASADRGTECHQAIYDIAVEGFTTQQFVEDWQEEMVDRAIAQREEVFKNLNYKRKHPQWVVHYEKQLSLEWVGRADVFGTADMVAYNEKDRRVVILDYKFGAGVPVEAEDNAQLMTYALGAAELFPAVKFFTLVIVQPRLYDQAKMAEYTRMDIDDWATNILLPGIAAADKDDAPRIPGAEQCRWCAAAERGCPAQHEAMLSLLPVASKTADNSLLRLSTERLSELLDQIPFIEQSIKQVQALAHEMATSGYEIPNYKLVRRVKHRAWVDEGEVIRILKKLRFKLDDFMTMKLVSPAKVEVLLKDNNARQRSIDAIHGLTHTPLGDLVLVPSSDKRAECKPTNMIEELPATPAQQAEARAIEIELSELL